MSFQRIYFCHCLGKCLLGNRTGCAGGIKGCWKSGLCRGDGRIRLTVAKGFNWLTETAGQPTPLSDSVGNTVLKEKWGINRAFSAKKKKEKVLMCDTFFSISPGKCGRLSNRCVLWALNHKIIKRHLTIRGMHSNIAPHHLSRSLHNAAALIESTQRALCKQVRKKKYHLVFIMHRWRAHCAIEGYHFVNQVWNILLSKWAIRIIWLLAIAIYDQGHAASMCLCKLMIQQLLNNTYKVTFSWQVS